MSFLTRRGERPSFPYAGQPVHVLAGDNGQPEGSAAMEITIPAQFAGPIPHTHQGFDEAIYVLGGRLQVTGDQPVVPRGQVHQPSNRSDGRSGSCS